MNDRQWFEGHLMAYSVGLLGDEEVERFESLRAGACADLWAEYSDEAPGESFHLSPAMIARWNRAKNSLGELERGAIEHHLQHCSECAEEVELFGQLHAARPAPRRAVVSAPRPDWRRSWFSGGVVGALAASLVFFLVLDRGGPEPEQGELLQWVAPARVRGDSMPSFSRLVVPANTQTIGLTMAVPTGLNTSIPARMEVLDPDLRVLLALDVPPAELGRAALIATLRSTSPLEAGAYVVRFTQAGLAEPLEQRFELMLK